jgi:hypothetical protein
MNSDGNAVVKDKGILRLFGKCQIYPCCHSDLQTICFWFIRKLPFVRKS